MKKFALILPLPMLLFGGAVWTKQVAWNQFEDEYRHQILLDIAKFKASGGKPFLFAEFYTPQNNNYLGQWNEAETRAILADVHFRKPTTSKRSSRESSIVFYVPSGDCYKQSGFGVALDGSQGYIGSGVEYAYEANQKWRDLELTPQSCAALKKRVLSRYGAKIAALKAKEVRARADSMNLTDGGNSLG